MSATESIGLLARPEAVQPSHSMRVAINDYAGHPFQVDLARKLAEDGHDVTFLYCGTNVTPHGDLTTPMDGLTVTAVSTGSTFEKYGVVKRALQEIRYGFESARNHRRANVDVILTSNVPVLSLLVIRAMNRATTQVLWLQDIQSGLAKMVLKRRGRIVASLFATLERLAIKSADSVVAIAPSLADELFYLGVEGPAVDVIENWAPLDELPCRPRDNEWAERHDLVDKFVFLYSGSLGIKHRPELLKRLSDEFQGDPDVRVVVVSEGVGAEWLRAQQLSHGLDNLLLLPYQPFDTLPDVLGSADVLVALLEQEVGSCSVPSKVLSYFCAGRPILASLPATNSSSELIESRAQAGVVSVTEQEFLADARALLADPDRRRELGTNGRLYAATTFDIDRISKRFLAVLTRGLPGSTERAQ